MKLGGGVSLRINHKDLQRHCILKALGFSEKSAYDNLVPSTKAMDYGFRHTIGFGYRS